MGKQIVSGRNSVPFNDKELNAFRELAGEIAQVAYWKAIRMDTQWSFHFSEEANRIFGFERDTFSGSAEQFLSRIHRDDWEKVTDALNNVSRTLQFILDHRVVLTNKAVRWVRTKAILISSTKESLTLAGIYQDITHQRRTEEILTKFYERYEFLSKATKDALWDWNINHDFITWNHGLETIFGYKEREFRDARVRRKELVHPDDYYRVTDEINRAFTNHQSNWQSTYRYRCLDGTYKYVYDRAYIIYDKNKNPERMIGAMQDITESIESMNEIRKLSLVASSTDNVVVIMDRSGGIEWTNQSFFNMTGYTQQEVAGKILWDVLAGPETDPVTVERINTKLKNKERVSEEIVNYSKSGKKFWMRVVANPVFDESGNLQQYILVQSDISNQKEFELSITSIARELANLIETANVPILGVDRNGYINEWNKAAQKTTGFTRTDVLGKKVLTLFTEDHTSSFHHMVNSVMHGNFVSNFELPILTKDGERRTFLFNASPRKNPYLEIIGIIFVAQDITELTEYRTSLEVLVANRTKELNEALLKEKELVDIKGKFVSIASHEFRTPLSTISLAAGYLKRYAGRISPDTFNEKIGSIEKQVEHMKHLLDDILTIGKGDAGKIQVQLTTIQLEEFLHQLKTEVEYSTGETHIIRLSKSDNLPQIQSDEKLLRNILTNLLTNAIKFSPGSKYVDLDVFEEGSFLHATVKDYGIGIPEEDRKRLFEPFHRGSNVNTIQGTGLGLSIVKKAVELLGGKLELSTTIGAGTTFRVKLPKHPVHQST